MTQWGTSKSCYAFENLKGRGWVGGVRFWSVSASFEAVFETLSRFTASPEVNSISIISILYQSCARHMRGLVEGVAEEVNETV